MAKRESGDRPRFYYGGFSSPRFTQMPNDLVDTLMPELSEAELKVLLYIVRRTFGFGKNADAISLTQMIEGIRTREGKVLDRGTGVSRSSVRRGVAGLEEKGIIVIRKVKSDEGDYETNVYSLRFRHNQIEPEAVLNSNHPAQGVVSPQNDPGFNLEPGVGPNQNPQEIEEQKKDRQETEVEHSKPANPQFDEIGARMTLLPFVEDFAREFNDQAPLRSSVSRMVNLYRDSGLGEEEFIDVMYKARARTKEYASSIKSEAVNSGPWKTKARMAYFYTVVKDMAGVKAGEGDTNA